MESREALGGGEKYSPGSRVIAAALTVSRGGETLQTAF
jgi:hypothetical protein